jgi:DNA repair exonuclease SbcCD ATPase subunit
MRRDAYASHVKAKHMKEIATLVLEDFKEYEVNTIKTYACEGRATSMVIQSKMYQDAEYWFGVKPFFYIRDSIEVPYDPTRPDTKVKAYPEDLELSQYLKREENMIAHRRFIEEVLQSISLMDFIQIGKNLAIRNPNVLNMKKELSTLNAIHKALEVSSQNQIEQLKKEVELWKETAEEKECIADLRKDLQYARSYASQLEKRSNLMKDEMEFQKEDFNDRWAGLNQANCTREREADYREDGYRKEISDLKAQLEKCKIKVKEEAQKLFDKEREAKQKVKDKKALEKAKAKKLAKKAKKLAELSDSDSASDSDSD